MLGAELAGLDVGIYTWRNVIVEGKMPVLISLVNVALWFRRRCFTSASGVAARIA